MAKLKKTYSNKRPRGGVPGVSVDTTSRNGRTPKNYHRQELAFHGSEANFQSWSACKMGY